MVRLTSHIHLYLARNILKTQISNQPSSVPFVCPAMGLFPERVISYSSLVVVSWVDPKVKMFRVDDVLAWLEEPKLH